MSAINLNSVKCIRFKHFGDPKTVLHLDRLDLGEWDGKCALIRWLASPINPCDHFIIKGEFARRYKPKLPAIGGYEAVGIVEKIGENAEGIKVGDRVIRCIVPSTEDPKGGGLWTECSFMRPEALLRIDPQMDLVSAATLTINPATAYAMVKEIVPLAKGDCIIQNGANSALGRIVIQLAKNFGFQTINLIRKERGKAMAEELRSMGANWVFSYEEYADIIKSADNKLPECKLGLNCVGGEAAYLVSKGVAPKETMVTFGEISGEEPKFAEGVLPQFFGVAYHLEKKSPAEVKQFFGELEKLIMEGKLQPPAAQFHKMDEFQKAVENSISHGTKQILLLSQSADEK